SRWGRRRFRWWMRKSDGTQRTMQTPTATLQDGHGQRVYVTATSQGEYRALVRDRPAPVPGVVANTLALVQSLTHDRSVAPPRDRRDESHMERVPHNTHSPCSVPPSTGASTVSV